MPSSKEHPKEKEREKKIKLMKVVLNEDFFFYGSMKGESHQDRVASHHGLL